MSPTQDPHDSGREIQPDDAADVRERAAEAERQERHSEASGDAAGQHHLPPDPDSGEETD